VDILARLDKREFGVVLPYTGTDAEIAGKRILHALEENEAGLPLKGRFGVAVYPDDGIVTAQGLLKSAKPGGFK
jgi:GGDEF domain-containing protein